MSSRVLTQLVCAMAIAAAAAAQDTCPMQTTQHVAGDVTYGPPQRCGGIDYQIGDVQISTMRDGCPLFAIYVPPHDVAVASATRTQVDVVGTLPITQLTFRCDTRWFLVVPIGSSCIADKQLNVGTVQQLLSRPCPPTT